MKSRQVLATDYRLGTLIGAVRSVTRRQLGWADTAELVAERLRQHLPDPDILPAGQRAGDPQGYACHLLHAEGDGSFSVVALVWRPGQATPIHDHVTWCAFGVLQGSEREERFLLGEHGRLEPAGMMTNVTGDVTSLAPPGDIHRVRNAAAQTSISLHIYGTDVGRLASSVRRTYHAPVAADLPHLADAGPARRRKVNLGRWLPLAREAGLGPGDPGANRWSVGRFVR